MSTPDASATDAELKSYAVTMTIGAPRFLARRMSSVLTRGSSGRGCASVIRSVRPQDHVVDQTHAADTCRHRHECFARDSVDRGQRVGRYELQVLGLHPA